jgi:hypothetical protein
LSIVGRHTVGGVKITQQVQVHASHVYSNEAGLMPAASTDMSKKFVCQNSKVQSVPIRWALRLSMWRHDISPKEALNCEDTVENPTGANFGEVLKAMMNRWKADGLDLETGKVNYLRLARAKSLTSFRGSFRHYANPTNLYWPRAMSAKPSG